MSHSDERHDPQSGEQLQRQDAQQQDAQQQSMQQQSVQQQSVQQQDGVQQGERQRPALLDVPGVTFQSPPARVVAVMPGDEELRKELDERKRTDGYPESCGE